MNEIFPYNFILERSKRKTLSIVISEDSKITVKAPYRLSETRVKNFLYQKKSWVDKIIQKQKRNKIKNKRIKQQLEDTNSIFLFGQIYRIRGEGALSANPKTNNQNIEDFWSQHFKIQNKEIFLSEFVIKFKDLNKKIEDYKNWLLKNHIIEKIDFYLPQLRLSEDPKIDLKIKTLKSKWGSCKYQIIPRRLKILSRVLPRKVLLTFNSKLSSLPVEIIDYVIVHELCHILEPNHSKKFWSEVKKIYPNYENSRKWLRQKSSEYTLD